MQYRIVHSDNPHFGAGNVFGDNREDSSSDTIIAVLNEFYTSEKTTWVLIKWAIVYDYAGVSYRLIFRSKEGQITIEPK